MTLQTEFVAKALMTMRAHMLLGSLPVIGIYLKSKEKRGIVLADDNEGVNYVYSRTMANG